MNIIGISNLILDYYFYNNEIYVNNGGSVANILANLAYMNRKTKIIGYYGNDNNGIVAKSLLEKAGVNTSLLEMKNYNTKCFFINKETTSTCPFCGNKTKNYKLNLDIEKHITSDDIILIQDYTLLPNIKNKICLDLGYYNKFIYEDNKNIEDFIFRKYYIVNIKDTTLDFILKKLNISFNEFLNKINIYFLIITKGKNGASIIYNNEIYNYNVTEIKGIETNGCGDIFLATFIDELLDKKVINKKVIDSIFNKAQENVEIVLNNIGARNHIVKNVRIKKLKKCICQDFYLEK